MYNSGSLREVLEYIEPSEFIDGEEVTIRMNFNIRTGNLGKFVDGETR